MRWFFTVLVTWFVRMCWKIYTSMGFFFFCIFDATLSDIATFICYFLIKFQFFFKWIWHFFILPFNFVAWWKWLFAVLVIHRNSCCWHGGALHFLARFFLLPAFSHLSKSAELFSVVLSDAGTSRFVLIVGKIKQPPTVKHKRMELLICLRHFAPLHLWDRLWLWVSGWPQTYDRPAQPPRDYRLCHHFRFGCPLLENSLLLRIVRIR